MTPKFTTGADLFGSWFADVERGEPPVRFAMTPPFASLDTRPGRMLLLGGAPGAGKTAALLQVGIDLLRLNPVARLLVANVEMVPAMLVDRIVSRLACVPISSIADRTLTPDELERVRVAVACLEPVAGRLAFLQSPYSLEHVAAAGTMFDANAIILDYIQRFQMGDGSKERRDQLEAGIGVLRRFCDAGAMVLVAAAVSRQRDRHGSSYSGLNLASFRGSSELEFGCDAAYLAVPDDDGGVNFNCAKNRYGDVADIATIFDAERMTFAPAPVGLKAFDTVTAAAQQWGGGSERGTQCDA